MRRSPRSARVHAGRTAARTPVVPDPERPWVGADGYPTHIILAWEPLASALVVGSGGQLVDVFDKMGSSVVGVEQVPKSKLHRYGVIKGKRVRDDIYKVDDLVEKPSPEEAPSDLAIIGRYVFQPEIFKALEKIGVGKGGEYQLTDAMRLLCRKGGLYGLRFKGRRFDIGSKADYVRATVALSMERKDLGEELGLSLESIVRRR